jgi:uncharacterized protein YdhG (YjbR/CyaY superfamily)
LSKSAAVIIMGATGRAMKDSLAAPRTVDGYISSFPRNIQKRLESLRRTIRASAPGAEERISYRMPAFYLGGNLVYFAAFRNHIGFFPTSSGVEAFQAELAGFAVSKGTVRFPHDKPLPLRLVARIVRFRVAENLGRSRSKAGLKG